MLLDQVRTRMIPLLVFLLSITSRRSCIAFQHEQQQPLQFAAPSDSPSYAPSISFAPTKSHSPTSIRNKPSASPVAPNTPKPNNSTTPAPTLSPHHNAPSPTVTSSPTRVKPKYTTDPTSSPTITSSPSLPPSSSSKHQKHGFFYVIGQLFKWTLIIGFCAVVIFFAHKHWDEIYYFLMQMLHKLSVCCEQCLNKCKQIVTRMIIRTNVARVSSGGGEDDGSMLDGLLMGERD